MKTLKKTSKAITQDFQDYPIVKYLKIQQPTWTKVFAIKMIRKKQVTVNGEKTRINYRLQTGDSIEITGGDEKNAKPKLNIQKLPPLQIIFENKNLIIVNKEEGIDVQGDSKNHAYNNMNNRLWNHLNWNPENKKWKPVFVHRLDYNTTGLLIGAKNYQCCKELEEAFKRRKIQKYYRVVVAGFVGFKQKTIHNRLLKKGKKVYVVDGQVAGSKEAISEVSLVKHDFERGNSILEVKIITGRTHQIRAHLAHIGHPVRGDQKYGVEKEKKTYKTPQLTAYKLTFDEDLSGEKIKDLRGKVIEIRTDI